MYYSYYCKISERKPEELTNEKRNFSLFDIPRNSESETTKNPQTMTCGIWKKRKNLLVLLPEKLTATKTVGEVIGKVGGGQQQELFENSDGIGHDGWHRFDTMLKVMLSTKSSSSPVNLLNFGAWHEVYHLHKKGIVTKHREHWAISKALDGNGRRMEPRTPIIAEGKTSKEHWHKEYDLKMNTYNRKSKGNSLAKHSESNLKSLSGIRSEEKKETELYNALVRNISIVDIITAFRPRKRSCVPFGGWNEAVQFFLFSRTMPFPIDHILSRESHCSVLLLARSIISIFYITRLEYFSFRLRRFNNFNIVVMGFKTQIGQNSAICHQLINIQCKVISLPRPTSLPCSQKIKETAQTKHSKY
ncbi:hypothetical protein CR513_37921, partial [Mucuna pruriens]